MGLIEELYKPIDVVYTEEKLSYWKAINKPVVGGLFIVPSFKGTGKTKEEALNKLKLNIINYLTENNYKKE